MVVQEPSALHITLYQEAHLRQCESRCVLFGQPVLPSCCLAASAQHRVPLLCGITTDWSLFAISLSDANGHPSLRHLSAGGHRSTLQQQPRAVRRCVSENPAADQQLFGNPVAIAAVGGHLAVATSSGVIACIPVSQVENDDAGPVSWAELKPKGRRISLFR